MLTKIVLVSLVLATASSDPVRRSITLPNDLSNLFSDKGDIFEIAIKPETISSIKTIAKSIIGYKISALAIGLNIVKWVVSNFVGIAIGGVIALGVCKITGKCSLDYDQTFSKLCSFITPERMEMAQNLFMNAVSRFGQEDEEEEIEFE